MSTLRANTVANAAGTGPATLTAQEAAKAHANYDHTVPSITRSLNVSSITDVGTGDFTTNFTNSFDAADYHLGGCCEGQTDAATSEAILWAVPAGQATGSDDNRTSSGAGGAVDTGRTCPNYMGDLA